MSYFITGNIETNYVNISTTTPTEVQPSFQARAMVIASIRITEVGGGTPAYTLDVFDGTSTFYIRNQVTMTARQTIVEDEPIWLANGSKLRVTINTGSVSVIVNYFNPNASSRNMAGTVS